MNVCRYRRSQSAVPGDPIIRFISQFDPPELFDEAVRAGFSGRVHGTAILSSFFFSFFPERVREVPASVGYNRHLLKYSVPTQAQQFASRPPEERRFLFLSFFSLQLSGGRQSQFGVSSTCSYIVFA